MFSTLFPYSFTFIKLILNIEKSDSEKAIAESNEVPDEESKIKNSLMQYHQNNTIKGERMDI